jgi:glycosyltransferase involved in cell wall biosynthesis
VASRQEALFQKESEALEGTFKQVPLFSVVIPTHNEEANIARCLDSLRRMDFSSALFEVLVVDNGSTDTTRALASSFQNVLPLRVLDKPDAYISAVRNAGAKLARGQFLAFLDSDCEAPADWLSQARQVVSAGGTGAFGNFYRVPAGSSWIARYWYEDRDQKKIGPVPFLPAGDLFVSLQLFRAVGGFDESIQTNEDFELCQRIRRAGLPIESIPSLGVVHWGTPQTLSEFFRKHRWHGMHVFKIFLRNLPALYNFNPVGLAVYTLFCLFGILAGIILAILRGHVHVLSAFLLAITLPATVLGTKAAISSRSLRTFLPMTVLYLTYGLARASSLIQLKGRNKASHSSAEVCSSEATRQDKEASSAQTKPL